MTTNQPDRIDRIEALLERFIDASFADRQASSERMTRLEQVVDSNNRFLQAFSTDLKRYTDTMHTFLPGLMV